MKNIITTVIIKLSIGAAVGYTLSHHLSHPSGRGRKHVPLMRIGRVQLMPNLLIATKRKRWHIHHWAYLPTLYLPLIAFIRPLIKKHWLHGLFLGAMLHGLSFEDRFRFSI